MSAPIRPIRLSIQNLCLYIGVSAPTIYNKLNPKHKDFDSTFPNPIKEGVKNLFLTDEIDLWVKQNAEKQRNNNSTFDSTTNN